MKKIRCWLVKEVNLIYLCTGVVALLWGVTYYLGDFEVSDERHHLIQIRMFLAGDFSLHPFITMIPGYHFVTSQFAFLFSLSSLQSIRLINAFYGLLLLLSLIAYLRLTPPSYPQTQSLQIIGSPIIWPFLWLVYTDVLAILTVVAIAILVDRRRYTSAAFCGLFSILIRQPNVVWIGLFWIIALHQEGIFGFIK